MTIYSERVQLASPRERILNSFALVFLLGLLWFAVRGRQQYSEFFDITVLAVQGALALLAAVHNSLATSLKIDLSEEQLSLRVGLFRTKTPLSTIVEARPYPQGKVHRPRVWLELLALSFVSGAIKSQVEIHISGGKLIHFSTLQPEYLAELINRQAGRAFRQDTLKLIGAHKRQQSRASQ